MLKDILRPHILELIPYSTARDEYSGEARVYLDANESPFGSPVNRYPDPHTVELRNSLASVKGIQPENIFTGNGSDEAIDIIIRAVAAPGQSIVITPPTYGMYSVAARTNDVRVEKARLNPDFSLPLETIARLSTQGAKAIFLCSPNNPTGHQLSLDDIRAVLAVFSGLVVVDEAYIDFASGPSAVALLAESDRIVILQTMSKAWGLAGVRVGLAIACPDFIAVMNTMKLPYNISILSQRAAIERLREPVRLAEEVQTIIQERERLRKELQTIDGIETVFPSQGNFLLIRCRAARSLFEDLRAAGVIVRDRSSEHLCASCLRITIGTESENNELLTLIRRFA